MGVNPILPVFRLSQVDHAMARYEKVGKGSPWGYILVSSGDPHVVSVETLISSLMWLNNRSTSAKSAKSVAGQLPIVSATL